MSYRVDTTNPVLLVVSIGQMLLLEEAEALRQSVVAHVQQHGKFRALVELQADFAGLAPAEGWTQDTFEDEWLQQQVEQIAIVGSPDWADHALLFFLSGIVPAPIKFFPTEQESLARAWLGDQRYLMES